MHFTFLKIQPLSLSYYGYRVNYVFRADSPIIKGNAEFSAVVDTRAATVLTWYTRSGMPHPTTKERPFTAFMRI
jgi:hypothetical protein